MFYIWQKLNVMKTYLLPSKFLVPSGIIFYASVLLGVLLIVFPDLSQNLSIELSVPNFFWKDADNLLVEKSFWIQNNMIDELLTLLLVGSGLIHLFSKEKLEDEFIMQLRFHAMKWSYLLNFTVLAIGSLLVYGLPYFNVMVFCLFSQLVCYHLVFRIFVLQHLRKWRIPSKSIEPFRACRKNNSPKPSMYLGKPLMPLKTTSIFLRSNWAWSSRKFWNAV